MNSLAEIIKRKDAVVKGLVAGSISAACLNSQFHEFADHEREIKAVLFSHTMKELKQVFWTRCSSDKKEFLVDGAYHEILEYFAIWSDKGIMYNPLSETYLDALKRIMSQVTDEKLQEYAAKQKEKIEFKKKALQNPETILEFQEYLSHKKELSPSQLQLYDSLRCEQYREEKKQQKKTVKPVSVDENLEMRIVEHYHSKRDCNVYIVTLSKRVERNEYTSLLSRAKQLGGWYSKPWKGSPAGFLFLSRDDAEKFAANSRVEMAIEEKEQDSGNAADYFQEKAEKYEQDGTEKLEQDRQVNTTRRLRIARGVEADARGMITFSHTLKNIAVALSENRLKYLGDIRTMEQVKTLQDILRHAKYDYADKFRENHREWKQIYDGDFLPEMFSVITFPVPSIHISMIERICLSFSKVNGYKRTAADVLKYSKAYSAHFKTHTITLKDRYLYEPIKKLYCAAKGHREVFNNFDHYANQLLVIDRLHKMGIEKGFQLREALREFLTLRGTGIKADPVKEKERDLVRKNFDGRDFFPTPAKFAFYLIQKAKLDEGLSVLEPSAGKGDIADVLKDVGITDIDVVEIDHDLQEILEIKEYNLTCGDFLKIEPNGKLYDRVIMNPPFSKNQDAAHVRHAYDFLKPGGRLVAIMSEHSFFATDSKSVEFQEWLSGLHHTVEKHENVFKNGEINSTGVRCRVVVIDK